jgi:hypothetical protein
MSPIELALDPQFHPQPHGRLFRRSPGGWLYRTLGPGAHGLKVLLQMLTGAGAAADISWQVFRFIAGHARTLSFYPHATTVIVSAIAYALAVAAAIELAYTLFTPGPDEALDPLMLGLSSALLLLVTKDGAPVAQFSGVLIGVAALGALFFIRHRWVTDDE